MAFLIVTAVVAVWLFVGARYTAPRAITRSLRNRVSMWHRLTSSPVSAERMAEWRREAVADNVLMIAVGPLALAFFALHDYLLRSAPLTDVELEQRVAEQSRRAAEQAKRIAELERELGIDSGTGLGIDSRTQARRAHDRRNAARDRWERGQR